VDIRGLVNIQAVVFPDRFKISLACGKIFIQLTHRQSLLWALEIQ
jgi:hypothetical protein